MSSDVLEFPSAFGLQILFEVLKDLVVGDNFFIFIVVHGASELDHCRVTGTICLILDDGFEDLGMELLPVLFRKSQKCAANQGFWVQIRHCLSTLPVNSIETSGDDLGWHCWLVNAFVGILCSRSNS